MKIATGVFGLLLISSTCLAGVERILVEASYGECTVRVSHDAVPGDREGTIVYRSYRIRDGLHHPCETGEDESREALGRGLAAYRAAAGLQPASSIMIGRLIRYPWITRALEQWSRERRGHTRLTHGEFNALVMSPEISGSFVRTAEENGMTIRGASCEKLMFSADGAPIDALCGYILEPHR